MESPQRTVKIRALARIEKLIEWPQVKESKCRYRPAAACRARGKQILANFSVPPIAVIYKAAVGPAARWGVTPSVEVWVSRQLELKNICFANR